MITEARSKSMKKFKQMNCLKAMEEFPVETAKAFLYMIESRGWQLDSVGNQSFIDYFREDRGHSSREQSKWFDGNNDILIHWQAEYPGLKKDQLSIRMKVRGTKLYVSSLTFDYRGINKAKPIDLNRPIEEAFGEVADMAKDVGDTVAEFIASGNRSLSADVNKTLKDKYKSNQEKSYTKKLQPLRSYLEKQDYDLKISKNYNVYTATIKPTSLANLKGVNSGIKYSHQYLEYSRRLPLIIKKFNQAGLWLIAGGIDAYADPWLEFKPAVPSKASEESYGRDLATGERRSREKEKENLKLLSYKEMQTEHIEQIIDSLEKAAKKPEIYDRYYETIKHVFDQATGDN